MEKENLVETLTTTVFNLAYDAGKNGLNKETIRKEVQEIVKGWKE